MEGWKRSTGFLAREEERWPLDIAAATAELAVS